MHLVAGAVNEWRSLHLSSAGEGWRSKRSSLDQAYTPMILLNQPTEDNDRAPHHPLVWYLIYVEDTISDTPSRKQWGTDRDISSCPEEKTLQLLENKKKTSYSRFRFGIE